MRAEQIFSGLLVIPGVSSQVPEVHHRPSLIVIDQHKDLERGASLARVSTFSAANHRGVQ